MAIINDKLEAKEYSKPEKGFSLLSKSFSKHLIGDAEKTPKDKFSTPSTTEISEYLSSKQTEAETEPASFITDYISSSPQTEQLLGCENLPSTSLDLIHEGWSKFQESLFPQASEILDVALKKSEPGSLEYFDILYLIGRCQLNFDLNLAFSVFQQLLERNTEEKIYWIGFGAIHGKLKSYYEAFQCFLKVITLNERSIEAWINIGIIYDLCQQPQNADLSYQMALKIKPKNQKIKFCIEKLIKNRNLPLEFWQPDINLSKFPFTKPPKTPIYTSLLSEMQQDKKKNIKNGKPNEKINPEGSIKNPPQISIKPEDSTNIIRPQLRNPAGASIENNIQIPRMAPISQPRILMPSPQEFQAGFIRFMHWYSTEVHRRKQNQNNSPKPSEEPANMLLNLVPPKRELAESKPNKKRKL